MDTLDIGGAMVNIVAHPVFRAATRLCIIAGAFWVYMCGDQALAMKVDPIWAAKHFHSARSVPLLARKHDLLTSTYSRGPHTRAALPSVLQYAREVRGIKITPTSASWKVNGLRPQLVKMLIKVQLHFGQPLHMVSGCRSKKHNRRVGGARRSQHLHCNAADFEIPGVSKFELAAYLKQMPGRGGVGLYCRSSYVHLDLGPKREWRWGCKRRKTQRKVAKLNSKHKSTRGLKKAEVKRKTSDRNLYGR